MKVSLNWVSKFTTAKLPIDQLVEKIGAQLGAVDEVVELEPRYKGIVVAEVVECSAHPNADKLSVCKIDDGGVVKGIKRDVRGLVQVVCGAPNVRAGQLVAWLPPGSIVPSTFAHEPLVIGRREIRGVVSFGMLGSGHELAINDDQSGILTIDEKIKPGTLLSDVLKLNDYIIDIENKMFTHRPDCFGLIGVARELAGIQGMTFKSPDWYLKPKSEARSLKAERVRLEVKNEIPKLVPRFAAIALSGVQVGPSPLWLQSFLSRVGAKPINNVVDLTNYYMLETGQPLHAYDADKLKSPKLIVRYANKGEKLKLLGGKVITLHADDIVIADKERAIGLGGVMGGADTEVGAGTKNIILECANFDRNSIHHSAMKHGLFTDAATRFTKNQSPLQNLPVILKTTSDLVEITGGEVASELVDKKGALAKPPEVQVTANFINERLSLNLKTTEIKKLLENVEFKVSVKGSTLRVLSPFWRTDIHIPEDIVEEVGRLRGYDHVPLELPKRDIAPAPRDRLLWLKSSIRSALSTAGANEILTYSFVHGDLFDKVGQDRRLAHKIANALSPDLHYYRLSLTPSLLAGVHPNIKTGFGQFALFELNKVHNKASRDEEALPREFNTLALVVAADDKTAKESYEGAPYYHAKKYLDEVLGNFGMENSISCEPLEGANLKNPHLEQLASVYEPSRSAAIKDSKGLIWGIIGEYKASVTRELKLPAYCAGFELDNLLFTQTATANTYTELPRFPSVEQDICLKIKTPLPYASMLNFIQQSLSKHSPANTITSLTPIDIYGSPAEPSHKQITWRLKIASYDRTLTTEVVNELLNKIASDAKNEFGAKRI